MNAVPIQECDVAIVGGGPAGATAACLLSERGYQVTVFEKATFPRFHIGESLLPANIPLLEKLGVRDQIEAISIRKNGVELVSPAHPDSTMLEFADCWDKTVPFSFHVRRSEFDEVLLNRATQLGSDVRQGWRVTDVRLGAASELSLLTVRSADTNEREQLWRARFVIDASGRDTLLANSLKLKRKNAKHNSSALYAHYTNAKRLPGSHEGNISIFWFEHGWMWFIPLADGVTSVGAVCWPYYLKSRQTDTPTFFEQTLALCPALAERLEQATRVNEVEATGNYSYSAKRSQGTNYLLLGDAFAFVDPIFSSGVFLAMNSAFVGADAIHAILSEPSRARVATKRFKRVMILGPREFSWFIYRINKPTMRNIFMTPANPFRVKEALLSVLAGDIFGKTPIWPSLYLFKGIYYLCCLKNIPRSVREWRQRRLNIRDVRVDVL